MRTHHRLHAGAALLAIALVVAACSGPTADSAPPSEANGTSPTPVATAAPSPTPPLDVATLFVAGIAKGSIAGGGPITGRMTLGALEIPISGEMQLDGKDSSVALVLEMPGGQRQSTTTVTVGGRTYAAKNDGPWFETTGENASTGDNAFTETLGAAALTVKDQGIVTKDGEPLHHLVPAGGSGFTGAQLGMTDPAMAAAPGFLEFYARDDGSLAVLSMGVDWTVDAQGTPVEASMAIEFAFDAASTAAVTAPSDVWVRFASERFGYSMGHPDGWTVVEGKDASTPDVIGASMDEYVAVMVERQPKAAADRLDAYARAFIDAQRRALDLEPRADETVTVLGQPARRLLYREPKDPSDPSAGTAAAVYTLLIRGRDGYWIATVGPLDYEADVVAFHEAQVETFELTGD